MKSKLFYLILMCIFINIINPIKIKAELYNYENAEQQVNKYIFNQLFDSSNTYLMINNMPYIYNGILTTNSKFVYGGMLNKVEYQLSLRGNSSYLSPGVEYWTLTESEENNSNQYFIDINLKTKGKGETSGVRVTEFIRDDILVNGSGTYADPWVFTEEYSIK